MPVFQRLFKEHLLSGEVGDVHEGVVEGGVDVGDAEHLNALADLRERGSHLGVYVFQPDVSQCVSHAFTPSLLLH